MFVSFKYTAISCYVGFHKKVFLNKTKLEKHTFYSTSNFYLFAVKIESHFFTIEVGTHFIKVLFRQSKKTCSFELCLANYFFFVSCIRLKAHKPTDEC